MQIDRRTLLGGVVLPPLAAILSACGGGGGGGTSSVSSSAGSSSSSSSSSSLAPITGYSPVSELIINWPTSRDERQAVISSLDNGGFVLVWTDFQFPLDDTSPAVLQGKYYDASGNSTGSINFSGLQATSVQQVQPAVSGLSGGGFVITWRQDSSTLATQVFSASGTKVGSETFIPTGVERIQSYPCIAALSNGGFVVCWMEDNLYPNGVPREHDIKGQAFTSSGALSGTVFTVSSEGVDGAGLAVAVAGLRGGGFVVTWDGGPELLPFHDPVVRAQLYDNSMQKIGSQILAGSETYGGQRRPAIAALANGGFVIGWEDTSAMVGNDTDGAIVGQLFSATGNKNGAAFLVNTSLVWRQSSVAVAGLANGQFIMSWNYTLNDIYATEYSGILGQVFNQNGDKFGPEFQVNSNQSGFQVMSVVAALETNGFAIAWDDEPLSRGASSVKARVFAPNY